MAWELSAERSKRLDAIVTHYPSPMAALLPALRLVQEEVGWIPLDGMRWISKRLGVPLAHIQGVASFYTLFHTKPIGRYVIQVCEGLSCYLAEGAEKLVDVISAKLGIGPGETTADGRFALVTVQCLGSCGTSPAMRVNDQMYEDLTREDLSRILEGLEEGKS